MNKVTIAFPTEEQATAFREQVLEMEGDALVGYGWYVQLERGESFVARRTADNNIEFLAYNEETDKVSV